MTPILYNAPTNVEMWLTFGAVHQQEHFQLVRQIFDKKQLLVPMLPIDPVPIDIPDAMLTWFQNHQGLHNLLNAALGTGGFDLSGVDFRDAAQTSGWMENHAKEHARISAVLAGIQVPSLPTLPLALLSQPIVPQPFGAQPGPQPLPALQAQPEPALQSQPQPALQPQPLPALQPQPGPAPVPGLPPSPPIVPGGPN